MHSEPDDEMTMADILLYPFIERIWALRSSFLQEMTTGINLEGTWQWFHRMSSFEFIQRFRAPEHRLRKVISLIKAKKYPGLVVPVTVYDD